MRINWKKTIGISTRHESFLRAIKDSLDFETETAAYKFCLSYALSYELPQVASSEEQRGTKWASGNFDDNEEISLLLRAMFPDETDHQALMMNKAEAGIEKIHRIINEYDITSLSELFDVTG